MTHLTIHFPSNFGEETTKVSYIGFRGEYTKAHRHGVTICNYELSPQMMDHKDKALDSVGKPIMWGSLCEIIHILMLGVDCDTLQRWQIK